MEPKKRKLPAPLQTKQRIEQENKMRRSPFAIIAKKDKNQIKKLDKEHKKALVIDSMTKEEKILKKANHKFWKILGSACVILITILVVACLIDIFNFTRGFFQDVTIGNIVGGSVTGFLVLLLLIFVIRPVIVALSTPVFTLDVVDNADKKRISRLNFKKLQTVARNIIKNNNNVSQDSKNKLKTFKHNRRELNNTLRMIYDTEIAKDINNTINNAAAKTFLSTAISQNNKLDAASVALINIRMIMQICVKCGYHPTYARLSKLIVKVFRNALIAYTVQSFNLEDIVVKGIDKLAKGALSAIPGLNEIAKSTTQGAANALLTMRIGIITRKYLYEEYNIQAMIQNPDEIATEIVNDAVNEANENIDSVIEDCKLRIKSNQKVSV